MFTLLGPLSLLSTLGPLVGTAHAGELTVAEAMASGVPASAKGSEECNCVVLDYGDKGTLRLTGDQVTGLQRIVSAEHALYAVVGEHRVRIADGLCQRVALMALSIAEWLHEDLQVVDGSGAPTSPGCTQLPTPLPRPR